MWFEFDEQKNIANKEKHGISFVEAQLLWEDLEHVIIPARTDGEPRSLLIGLYNFKIWSAIFTRRNDTIRIISVRGHAKMSKKSITTEEFDRKFEAGEDITAYLDTEAASRPNKEQKRVNVDFPVWMIQQLDREAKRLGVTRQSIIKFWLAERLAKLPGL